MTVFLVVAFAACVPVANWLVANAGTVCVTNGPCLVPVAPGLMAPSGVLMIGAAFALRDMLHERLGKWRTGGIIVCSAPLSAMVAPAPLAAASVLAYLASEMLDLAVYSVVRNTSRAAAVMASGVAGAVADSVIFSYIAFGSPTWAVGLIVGKIYASVALASVWYLRAWCEARQQRRIGR